MTLAPLMGAPPAQVAPVRRSALLRSLVELTRQHPTARKRIVGPDVNFGRELLVALARDIGGWIGWEPTNLRGVADALAYVPLAEQGIRIAGDVAVADLVDRALAHAVERAAVPPAFAELSRGHGFRRALRDTVLELRIAGVTPAMVTMGTPDGAAGRGVAPVLEEYERLLAAEQLADAATVFRAAFDAFDAEAGYVLDGVTAIVPGLPLRGLPGELLRRLLTQGAEVLDADAPVGLPAPADVLAPTPDGGPAVGASLLARLAAPATQDAHDFAPDDTLVTCDLFAAATPSEELREVCRRVLAEGRRWDEVEIVTTDPDTYGVALDALCQRVGIGATMLNGVPLARTRLGRALERWLAWLGDGLPADVLRQALEAGELRAPDDEASPTALARELRALQVGWGRARYEAAVETLRSGSRVARMTPFEGESDEDFEARRASRARAGAGLATLLAALLAITPAVPERGSDAPVRCSVAALAQATLGFLGLFAQHGPAEAQTIDRLRERLKALAELDGGELPFASALAAIAEVLADVRAWPLVTSDSKPWSASGGMLHLTDVAHAGTTGRARVFVVGLDADRVGGGATQDPFLPDAARRAIGAAGLPTTDQRREAASYALASALAGLRGRVTLSYATSGADGREAGPAPLLLQAWRLIRGDASLSYEKLRVALRPPASPVPVRDEAGQLAGIALLDGRDVWLDALADGALLLDGSAAVRAAFPMLAAGLDAHEAARGAEVTAHHGLVPAAGPTLDPTAHAGREISPSSLEKLAACPLAWYYAYGLKLRPPQDPDYDPDRWLDALERGSLLHAVYERFAQAYLERQDMLGEDVARDHVLAVADVCIAEWRVKVPPPGEMVFEQEAAEIRRAALAFLQMERDRRAAGDAGRWRAFEIALGGEPPAPYTLPDGRTLLVRGKADRVDALPDGTLRIVDYKTGGASRHAKDPKAAPFDGGRRLQPALYAAAMDSADGGRVSTFEYRFPTERGQNEVVAYTAGELEAAREVVAGLIAQVREGAFVPTDDTDDCGYCDHQPICRTTRGTYGNVSSPRATWAKDQGSGLPIYASLLARRSRGTPTTATAEDA